MDQGLSGLLGVEEEVLVEALGSDLTDDEFRLVVSGRAYPEALLAFAVSDP